ncbi:MAG: response regulator transcription factor [Beggiatoa sp.]|nr:response regulator transcription factor [Beggiatoa sp.]
METPKAIEPEAPYARRVLIVDDSPEIRLLVRTRLGMLDDVDVVGEASNGAEALTLVSALAPEAVILDLEMPVMRGDEAIPGMRELAPGMRILLYTAAAPDVLAELDDASKPDAIVRKDASLTKLVEELLALLDMGPFDVLRIVLGSIPLEQAITAFDTWVGLNVRILEALARGDELVPDQMSGATLEELQGLIGAYTHLGNSLQKAARAQASDVVLIVHLLRTTAAAARRALLAFNHVHLKDFYAAWGYEAEEGALTALSEMRNRLMDALPSSSGET